MNRESTLKREFQTEKEWLGKIFQNPTVTMLSSRELDLTK